MSATEITDQLGLGQLRGKSVSCLISIFMMSFRILVPMEWMDLYFIILWREKCTLSIFFYFLVVHSSNMCNSRPGIVWGTRLAFTRTLQALKLRLLIILFASFYITWRKQQKLFASLIVIIIEMFIVSESRILEVHSISPALNQFVQFHGINTISRQILRALSY
jgi:hypothetical protein